MNEPMDSESRPEIIFWFDTPPKVSKGAFNYVTRNWPNKVFYICNYDYPEYRKKNNWNDGDFGEAEVVMLNKIDNPDEAIDKIFLSYPDAIHVLAGFTTDITRRILKYFRRNPNRSKVVLFTERPVDMGGHIEKLLRRIYFHVKYRYFHYKFKRIVKAFLPLGQLGVKTFAKYGWIGENVYPFMYNPEARVIDRRLLPWPKNRPVRFLYVGRFYYKTKGIDVLMRAAEHLTGGWTLDLVGGYGRDAKKVIEWSEKKERVHYLGSWKSEDVCDRMQDYDIVVVPSRYDGWNLLVNEAINANVGVVSTDQAVSDEMITCGGMGLVVPGSDYKALARAMQFIIDNPETVDLYKRRASDYMPKASPESVGRYFMDIINFTFGYSHNRPVCPWLK